MVNIKEMKRRGIIGYVSKRRGMRYREGRKTGRDKMMCTHL